jgi:pSer/pThr/pTyr-binding forkhead associated (FHA) protein
MSRISTLRVKVFRGDELLVEREFTEPSVRIGRSVDANLRVDDASLGELHAVLNVEDDGKVRVLDLGTDAGTKIKGERIANATLSTGDGFELGDLRVEVQFDEAEGTTPTVDVRPEDLPAPEPAAATAVASAVAPPSLEKKPAAAAGAAVATLDERAQHLMELVTRAAGSGDGKGPKVLEVHQIWQNVLLETKHFDNGIDCTIGDAVGHRWYMLGAPIGWVPDALAPILKVSPPVWSSVKNEWRNDFYASEGVMPEREHGFHKLFEATSSGHVANLAADWKAHVEIGDERYTLEQLVAAGKARKDGNGYRIDMTDDMRLLLDVDGLVFYARRVQKGARVVTALKDTLDYPFLGITLFMGLLGLLFGSVLAFGPPASHSQVAANDDKYVELLLEKKQEQEQQKQKKPEGNKDAGEGKKAKKEEGKVGKKEAKLKEATGEKRQSNQAAEDRKIAENSGLLAAMDGDMSDTLGNNVGAMAAGIAGLIGPKGTQIGAGGLGGRGNGLGGGGDADGLGGLGNKGMGSGASGYGKGGGSFGGGKGSGGFKGDMGDPIIMGALDRSLIDAVIKRKMSQIRYCYQRELQKDPGLGGKLVIKFTIAKDGTVSQASPAENTVGSSAVGECVVQRFRSMQFPEPKGGGVVIVKYPFIFSPG